MADNEYASVSSSEETKGEETLKSGGRDAEIAAMNERELANLGYMSGFKRYFDGLRMGLQTRISEKPPVFETNEFTFFGNKVEVMAHKPLIEGKSWTALINPMNLLRGARNIPVRLAAYVLPKSYDNIAKAFTSIPLVKAVSYRLRQATGGLITMGVHLANFPIKTAALIHYTNKIRIMNNSIKNYGPSALCNQEAVDKLYKERRDTLKNWSISAVAVAGTASGAAIATVAPVAAAAYAVKSAGHGMVGKLLEGAALTKKMAIAAHEESHHLINLDAQGTIIEHLNELEKVIKDPKATSQDKMMASAQQKRMLDLHANLEPNLISKAKATLGFKTETKEDRETRIKTEATAQIKHYEKMRDILAQDAKEQANGISSVAPVSATKRAELLEAKTFAGKSGSR